MCLTEQPKIIRVSTLAALLLQRTRGRVSPHSPGEGSGDYGVMEYIQVPGSWNCPTVESLESPHGYLSLVYFCEVYPTRNHATLNVGI
jgi:hypothetical protein